jgi:hypothetical protein
MAGAVGSAAGNLATMVNGTVGEGLAAVGSGVSKAAAATGATPGGVAGGLGVASLIATATDTAAAWTSEGDLSVLLGRGNTVDLSNTSDILARVACRPSRLYTKGEGLTERAGKFLNSQYGRTWYVDMPASFFRVDGGDQDTDQDTDAVANVDMHLSTNPLLLEGRPKGSVEAFKRWLTSAPDDEVAGGGGGRCVRRRRTARPTRHRRGGRHRRPLATRCRRRRRRGVGGDLVGLARSAQSGFDQGVHMTTNAVRDVTVGTAAAGAVAAAMGSGLLGMVTLPVAAVAATNAFFNESVRSVCEDMVTPFDKLSVDWSLTEVVASEHVRRAKKALKQSARGKDGKRKVRVDVRLDPRVHVGKHVADRADATLRTLRLATLAHYMKLIAAADAAGGDWHMDVEGGAGAIQNCTKSVRDALDDPANAERVYGSLESLGDNTEYPRLVALLRGAADGAFASATGSRGTGDGAAAAATTVVDAKKVLVRSNMRLLEGVFAKVADKDNTFKCASSGTELRWDPTAQRWVLAPSVTLDDKKSSPNAHEGFGFAFYQSRNANDATDPVGAFNRIAYPRRVDRKGKTGALVLERTELFQKGDASRVHGEHFVWRASSATVSGCHLRKHPCARAGCANQVVDTHRKPRSDETFLCDEHDDEASSKSYLRWNESSKNGGSRVCLTRKHQRFDRADARARADLPAPVGASSRDLAFKDYVDTLRGQRKTAVDERYESDFSDKDELRVFAYVRRME